jgi:hypothetical protein
MPTRRRVTGLLATAMASGVIIVGAMAVTPSTYFDMHPKPATNAVAAPGASQPRPSTYFDM